jgi:hypothetical protein
VTIPTTPGFSDGFTKVFHTYSQGISPDNLYHLPSPLKRENDVLDALITMRKKFPHDHPRDWKLLLSNPVVKKKLNARLADTHQLAPNRNLFKL